MAPVVPHRVSEQTGRNAEANRPILVTSLEAIRVIVSHRCIVLASAVFAQHLRVLFRVAAIKLDPDYPFSIIGHPSREYLWILSRTPTMQPDRYARVLEQIESHGYTLDRLNLTPQPTPH
jgi:hypothetical protein